MKATVSALIVAAGSGNRFGGSLPKVWVTDAFLAGSTRDQNKVLQPIWVYYRLTDASFGEHDRLVIKWDDGTINGRRLAVYDPVNGMQ